MAEQYHIQINLLGEFSLRCTIDGTPRELTEEYSTSKRMWMFLQYMSLFHYREISQEEMIDTLWWDEESVNPANALKTILHRARTALGELGIPEDTPILLYKRGIYRWNSDIQVSLDTEQFEQLSNEQHEGNVEMALKAISLYKGDLLPNTESSPWVVSLRTYFHAKYIGLCHETAASLNHMGRCTEAMEICKGAINLDPYDEGCHLELMQSMVAQGLKQQALQHYTYVQKLFMEQLGVSPSHEMTAIYRKLNQSKANMEMDLKVIRGHLSESRSGGAFYCDFDVFQEIYRIDARRSVRSGWVIQLALITVLGADGEPLQDRRCSMAMEEMKNILQRSLRSGDVVARYSNAQYVVLLPTASYENGVMVLKRIQNNYKKTLLGMTTTLEYNLLPVIPDKESESSYFMAK